MLLVLAAHHGWSVRFFDVSRAFLHTPIKDPVFAVPPEEYQSPIPGGVWEMTKAVCGRTLWQSGRWIGETDDRTCCISLKPHRCHDVQKHGRWYFGWSERCTGQATPAEDQLSAVCCPALVLGAALLYILRVCDLK